MSIVACKSGSGIGKKASRSLLQQPACKQGRNLQLRMRVSPLLARGLVHLVVTQLPACSFILRFSSPPARGGVADASADGVVGVAF